MDSQSLSEKHDGDLSKDRSSNYRGRARLPLRVLSFREKQSRSDLDTNVKRLKKAFIKSRCERLEPSNVIPAMISQSSLDTIVELSKIHPELLLSSNDEPPLLETAPGFSIQCLDGESRVKAAKDILAQDDAWWTVDLYLDEADEELRRALAEQYSNQANPCDGDIYIKIREYQCRAASLQGAARARNHFAERRWWARLSVNRQKELKQLLRHESYASAFDEFCLFPALLAGLRISMIHDLMALKCEDEILQYLRHIRDVVVNKILAGNVSWMQKTDWTTLNRLQGLVPKHCEEDAKMIRRDMNERQLFPAIWETKDRNDILDNLRSIDCPIPTVDTLFENIRFLRPLSWAMRGLLDQRIPASTNEADKNRSVSRVFKEMYTDIDQEDDEVLIQVGKYSLKPYPGTKSDRIALGIWQLWLFAARNFTDLVSECPLKEDNQPAPKPNKPNASVWYDFALLACRLGFSSEKIKELIATNPDHERALATLLEARDPAEYEYSPGLLNQYQNEISEMFATATLRPVKPSNQCFRTLNSGESRKRRSGRPFENAYHEYRKILFPPVFWKPIEDVGEGVNALFIRVSVCNAFFGDHFSRIADKSPLGPRVSISEPRHGKVRKGANRVQELENRIGALQRALDTTDKDKEDTRSKYLELQAQFEKVSGERDAITRNSEHQISGLRSELVNANNHNSQLRGKLGQLENQVKHITTKLTEAENLTTNTRIKELSEKYQATISNLEGRTKQLEQTLEAKDRIEEDYTTQISNLISQQQVAQTHTKKLQNDLADARNHNEQLQKKLDQVKDQSLNMTETENSQMQARIKELTDEYQATINDLQSRQKQLNQNLEAKDKIITRLRKDQTKQEGTKKGREADLEAQLTRETKNRQDFEAELERQLEEKRKLEREVQRWKSEVDQFSARRGTLKDQNTQTDESSEGLEKEKARLNKELEQAKAEITRLREELLEIPRLDLRAGTHFRFDAGEQGPPDFMEFGDNREPANTSPRSKVTWYHGKDSPPDVQYMTLEEVTRLTKKYIRNKRSLLDPKSNRSLDIDLIANYIKEGQELEILIIADGMLTTNSPEDPAISSSRSRPVKSIRMGQTRDSPPRGLFANMLPVVPRAAEENDSQRSKKKKTLQKKGGEN